MAGIPCSACRSRTRSRYQSGPLFPTWITTIFVSLWCRRSVWSSVTVSSICRPTVASTRTRWWRAVLSWEAQPSITESPSARIRPGGSEDCFFCVGRVGGEVWCELEVVLVRGWCVPAVAFVGVT